MYTASNGKNSWFECIQNTFNLHSLNAIKTFLMFVGYLLFYEVENVDEN